MDRLEKIFDFILEADKEKFIKRQTYVSDGSRMENDAEHAWHAALMAMLLGGFAKKGTDIAKVVAMLLVHDIVEIDAGDTYAYDEQAKQSKLEREQKCAARLFSVLPEDIGARVRNLWNEFEEAKTQESEFAHVMDNLQPMMLNAATGGRSWDEHGVHIDQILKRNEHTKEYAPELWQYAVEHFLRPNMEKGMIKTDKR